jgi:hypothetical protein
MEKSIPDHPFAQRPIEAWLGGESKSCSSGVTVREL